MSEPKSQYFGNPRYRYIGCYNRDAVAQMVDPSLNYRRYGVTVVANMYHARVAPQYRGYYVFVRLY